MPINHKIHPHIVEVKNVNFSYGKEPVLEDVTLYIHKGGYLGIIGPNGGGKTTLLKIILGLLTPDSGSIRLFGQDIKDFKDWSKIGYIPQKAQIFEDNFPITVKEVVAQGRYAKKGLLRFLDKSDYEIINKAMTQVDILPYKNHIIGDLSGGQQQRVFIARALAGQPEIIFLDEPTVGVDAKTQEQFYGILKDLNKKLELTLVLVSHDIDVVASETTELACINKNLIYDYNPENFLRSEKFKKLYGSGIRFVFHTH